MKNKSIANIMSNHMNLSLSVIIKNIAIGKNNADSIFPCFRSSTHRFQMFDASWLLGKACIAHDAPSQKEINAIIGSLFVKKTPNRVNPIKVLSKRGNPDISAEKNMFDARSCSMKPFPEGINNRVFVIFVPVSVHARRWAVS